MENPAAGPGNVVEFAGLYILMGQSNMVGDGNVKGHKDGTLTHAVKEKGKSMVGLLKNE